MIEITDKHNCCGCSACVQACPKGCIVFDEDEQGFRYPFVNKDKCIDCGLCSRVCPVLNQNDPHRPIKVFAAINPNDDVRKRSSSGGIFTLLAEQIINEGGVVFGARFNDKWEVLHDYADTKKGVEAFCGSKYVQSNIGDTYKQAQVFLKKGRKVLFSGTSCQIAGLKRFLQKDYNALLTVDVVCHGVPSPKVWRDYLKETKRVPELRYISMKDKESGWKNYSYSFFSEKSKQSELASNNQYHYAFLLNLTLRLSCFNCPAKEGKSGSDITLADYWGIEHIVPQMDDNKGTSFVSANTSKGLEYLSNINMIAVETEYDTSIKYNSCIKNSTLEPSSRASFWDRYVDEGVNALLSIRTDKISFLKRLLRRLGI